MSTSTRVPLKRLARVSYGLGQPPPIAAEGVPIIRATNISRGRIIDRDMIWARLTDLPLDRAPLLRVGELLVVRSGAYTGDSALVTHEWEGSAPGYDLRVTPFPEVEPRFLAYHMLSWAFMDQVALIRSRAAQPHMNAEELGEIEVHWTNASEQTRVADFLDHETARIDAVIGHKQKLMAVVQERRQALVDTATVPGLAPGSGDWPLVPLRKLAAGGGLFTDGDWIEAPYITDGGIRLIQTGNIGVGAYREQGFRYVSEETFRELRCTEVRAGDVLICRLAEPVGRACLAPDLGGRMITSVDVCILRLDSSVDRRFIVAYLSSSAHLSLLESIARGGTRERVSRDQLGQVVVPLPPIEEQHRIANRLGNQLQSLNSLVIRLSQQIELLGEHRQALTTEAVTGMIDVSTDAA